MRLSFQNILNFFKRLSLVTKIIVGIVFIVAILLFLKNNGGDVLKTHVVSRESIREEVTVTGRVIPIAKADLAFERQGTVSNIAVPVGGLVTKGSTIMSLSYGESYGRLKAAEASVLSAEANLAQARRGTRNEELNLSQTKLTNAKTALNIAENDLRNAIRSAYVISEDAVRNYIDTFFNNGNSVNPSINIRVRTDKLEKEIEFSRLRVYVESVKWREAAFSIDTKLESLIEISKINLSLLKDLSNKVSVAINELTENNSGVSPVTIQEYRQTLTSALTRVNTAFSEISNAESALNSARSNFDIANDELVLKQAGQTNEDIIQAQANLSKAQAELIQAQASYQMYFLKSPIDGIVGDIDVELGETVQAGSRVVTVLSQGDFQIEVDIPEIDIAKINVGNPVEITLDAYGDQDIFYGEVISINPIERILGGIPAYKVKIKFIDQDERIRSGMTANLVIISAIKDNAIVVPFKALSQHNGRPAVTKVMAGTTTIVNVETGIRGVNGVVEILSGVQEGESVVVR